MKKAKRNKEINLERELLHLNHLRKDFKKMHEEIYLSRQDYLNTLNLNITARTSEDRRGFEVAENYLDHLKDKIHGLISKYNSISEKLNAQKDKVKRYKVGIEKIEDLVKNLSYKLHFLNNEREDKIRDEQYSRLHFNKSQRNEK